MNTIMLAISILGIASQTAQGDYGHAGTWLVVLLGVIIQVLDARRIRELEGDRA